MPSPPEVTNVPAGGKVSQVPSPAAGIIQQRLQAHGSEPCDANQDAAKPGKP